MIEKTLERLAEALERNNELLAQSLEFSRKGAPAAVQEPILPPTPACTTPADPGHTSLAEAGTQPEPSEVTIDTLRAACAEALERGDHADAIFELLAKHSGGTPKLSEVPEAQYAELLAEVNSL